ncbi:MAG TPA: type II toxin-antitoxin system VapC family toxin [Chloroflexota bacterium]|nr:type II toxin-antitoxin system VapC family toxin [Chloroflexota bacterium]
MDTNHLGRLLDPQHPVRIRLLTAIEQRDLFYILLPIITETVAGFSILPRAARNWVEWQAFRPSLGLLPLEEADAVDAARLQVTLHRRGRQLGTVDALIATAALRHDLTLLTTDGDFAAVPTLRLETWVSR